MLVVTLLLSLTTFSQSDINNEPQVCMPLSKARLVAQDLLRLDSLKEEHKTTLFILSSTQKKVLSLDSTVNAKDDKIQFYIKELSASEQKYKIASDRASELEKNVTRLQTQNQNLQGWIKGLGGGLISTATILLTALLIK